MRVVKCDGCKRECGSLEKVVTVKEVDVCLKCVARLTGTPTPKFQITRGDVLGLLSKTEKLPQRKITNDLSAKYSEPKKKVSQAVYSVLEDLTDEGTVVRHDNPGHEYLYSLATDQLSLL